ncbi:LppX_LprAFG lipoprotein [Nocardioides conyzicola]|uniref:LppX_LprAFG lipoprotein n=1 Tax=Nocardioides conyzicola TaxID=1651781 RepID=A0ABP8XUQ7_9ACTN
MARLPRPRRTAAALAVVSLLSVGLVGCGESDGSGSTAEDPAAAAVLANLDKGDQVDPADFVDTISDGLKASTTAHVTMKVGLGSMGEMSGEGDLDYTADPPAMAMTMDLPMAGSGTATEVRYVDGIFYMKLGGMSAGKFWKLDPSADDSPLGDMGHALDQLDPARTLEQIEPAIDRVTYAGDGHYELTVDPARVSKAMDLPAQASAQLPDSITYDVWLDDENRLSKMHMELPVAGSESTVDLSASDWGKDVTIEAPPASDITEMPDLGSMGGGTTGG